MIARPWATSSSPAVARPFRLWRAWLVLTSRPCANGPAGFFLGGTTIYANDPGVGIVLLPIGAVLLIVAIGLIALTRQN